MVKTLDPNAAYYFAGIPAYLMVGTDPLSQRTVVTVREIGTHALLIHTTDLEAVRQRLQPWGPPAQPPKYHAW